MRRPRSFDGGTEFLPAGPDAHTSSGRGTGPMRRSPPTSTGSARFWASLRSRGPGRTTLPTWTTRPMRTLSPGRGPAPASSPRGSSGRSRPARVALVTPQPYRVFAEVLALLFPTAIRPEIVRSAAAGTSPGSFVHPTARLEHGVTVDPGAVDRPAAPRSGPAPSSARMRVIGPQRPDRAGLLHRRECRRSPTP